MCRAEGREGPEQKARTRKGEHVRERALMNGGQPSCFARVALLQSMGSLPPIDPTRKGRVSTTRKNPECSYGDSGPGGSSRVGRRPRTKKKGAQARGESRRGMVVVGSKNRARGVRKGGVVCDNEGRWGGWAARVDVRAASRRRRSSVGVRRIKFSHKSLSLSLSLPTHTQSAFSPRTVTHAHRAASILDERRERERDGDGAAGQRATRRGRRR